MCSIRELIGIFFVILLLSSCGNKGDLYLPDAEPTMQPETQEPKTQSKSQQ